MITTVQTGGGCTADVLRVTDSLTCHDYAVVLTNGLLESYTQGEPHGLTVAIYPAYASEGPPLAVLDLPGHRGDPCIAILKAIGDAGLSVDPRAILHS